MAVAWLSGSGVAAAQNVTIEVSGLPPGSVPPKWRSMPRISTRRNPRPRRRVENPPPFLTSPTFGKPAAQSNQPQELFAYWDNCEDPPVLLFSDTARDDEDCRDFLGAFILRPGSTTRINVDVNRGTIRTNDGGMGSGGRSWTGLYLYGGVGGGRVTSFETSPDSIDLGNGFTQVLDTAGPFKVGKTILSPRRRLLVWQLLRRVLRIQTILAIWSSLTKGLASRILME